MGQTFGKSTWKGSAQRIRAAPDGSSVVLSETPLIAQATRLTLLQIDGGVRDLGTWSSVTGYSYGPDGREVWVSGDRDGSGPVLWAVSLNGEARVLARFPGEPVLHDVAPDGRALISMVERRLHTIAVIDGREQDLTWLSASGVRGITDDGRTIAFEDVSDRPGAARSVWIRTIDGAPAMRLGEGRPLEIAPKGDLVAATITGPPAKLVLYPTGPGDQRIVAEGAYDYPAASFLPEGDKLFFVETPSATHMDMPFTLKVADVRSGTITPLTSDLGAVHVRHAVAPDGRTVLLKRQGGAFFVVPIGAERWQWDAAEAIPGLAEPDFIRRWTPSGVYVMRFEPRTLRIDRVEIPSGKRTTWKQLAPTDLAGVDSPGTGGFFAVTPDGRAYAYSYERSLSTLYLVQGLR